MQSLNFIFFHPNFYIELEIQKEDLDYVFSGRKKVGIYQKVDEKHLKILEEAFHKVYRKSKKGENKLHFSFIRILIQLK